MYKGMEIQSPGPMHALDGPTIWTRVFATIKTPNFTQVKQPQCEPFIRGAQDESVVGTVVIFSHTIKAVCSSSSSEVTEEPSGLI